MEADGRRETITAFPETGETTWKSSCSKKLKRLGTLGDVVRVRPGYARNYLIPAGKAKYATEANMAEVQAHREELERKALEALSGAEQRKAKLDGFKVTIMAETHQEGKLFVVRSVPGRSRGASPRPESELETPRDTAA